MLSTDLCTVNKLLEIIRVTGDEDFISKDIDIDVNTYKQYVDSRIKSYMLVLTKIHIVFVSLGLLMLLSGIVTFSGICFYGLLHTQVIVVSLSVMYRRESLFHFPNSRLALCPIVLVVSTTPLPSSDYRGLPCLHRVSTEIDLGQRTSADTG